MSNSVWDDVVGQDRAVERLRRAAADPVHAYLLVGPHGSTVERAARAFAAMLLTGSEDADSRDARLVMAGEHPDCREVERVGAAIDRDQAEWINEQAWLSPVEGASKVMLLHEFHLLSEIAAGRLLKTVEEPPESTRFVILAESVPTSLVTIASRCVRVDFATIPDAVIRDRLIAEGGSFTINLWDSEETRPFVKFSKPATDDGETLNGRPVRNGTTGAPIFDEAIAWMECEVRQAHDLGTHTLFIGEVVDAAILDDEKRPAAMTDTRMKYGGVRRGGH